MNRRTMLLTAGLLVVALAGAQQPRQAPQLPLPAEVIQKIEAAVAAEQSRQNIPAVSVAVAKGNQVLLAKAWGMADLENNVAVTTATRFRTASIAKPMTAAAVMQLAEQGKLDLDAPVQKYCPAFPEKPWPVTARQLLGHLGGVRHYQAEGEASGTEHFFTIPDALRVFKDDPLLHEPGTKYNYSTYGYNLLGCAVEGASGMNFAAYLERHVYAPAGMERTRTDHHYAVIADRVRGYAKINARQHAQLPAEQKEQFAVGQIVNASLHDTSMKVPGGGLLSTPTDLVKFALAMLDGKLVKPETRAAMWTWQKARDGAETTYGLGWGVSTTEGMQLISHSGGQAGTSTLLVIFPDERIVVAVMTNLQGAATTPIARAIAMALRDPAVR